jgi:hypothetical protein
LGLCRGREMVVLIKWRPYCSRRFKLGQFVRGLITEWYHMNPGGDVWALYALKDSSPSDGHASSSMSSGARGNDGINKTVAGIM